MAAIDNLNNAVAALQSTVNAVSTKVDELKNQTPSNEAEIQAAADAITAEVNKLNQIIA